MPNSAITFNSSGMPSGLIFPYAGNAVPSGFLDCDGQEVDKTAYPNLYAAIQDTYATQINPTTGLAWAAPAAGKFRVPDYRGIFLRGVGTASGKDAVTLGGQQGEKTKTPTNAFTTAAQTVTGSVGGSDGTHSHSGATTSIQLSGSNAGNVSSASAGAGSGGATLFNTTVPSTGSGHGHSHSLTAPASTVNGGGDNETRPINKGVKYIIKA